MLTYEKYRRRQLLRIKFWCLFGFLAIALLVGVLAVQFFAEGLDTLIALKLVGAAIGAKAETLGFGGASVTLLVLAWLIYKGLRMVLGRLDALAALIFDRTLDRLNDDLFDPVPHPVAAAAPPKPLPWMPPNPQTSARRLGLWTSLDVWARQGADMASADAMPFAWALLTGRPGAGKSRLADEFARHLGRRELLGSASVLPSGWAYLRLRARTRLAAAWRRACRQAPLPEDPWDAGKPAHWRNDVGNKPEMQALEDFNTRLDQWRPRAPTLIVLEDPRAGEAEHLVGKLDKRHAFAVRLLIVNQTVPDGLRVTPKEDASGRWASALGRMTAGPWVVDEGHYLGWADWPALVRDRFAPDDPRQAISEAQFLRVTRQGHPLLVESLVYWLESQPRGTLDALARLTPEQLLVDRAERVNLAFRVAGLKQHAQWCVLAAATLTDGLPHPPSVVLEKAALQRVFPNENVQTGIPPIRPDLIGYAFIDLLVGRPQEEGQAFPASDAARAATAQQIATLAWSAKPAQTVQALLRLRDRAAVQAFGSGGSNRREWIGALEALLATASPAAASSKEAIGVARACALYHLLHGGRSLDAVRFWLARVEPAQAQQIALEDVLAALQTPQVAARDAITVFSLAMERGLSPETAPDVVLEAFLEVAIRLALVLEPRGVVPYHESLPPGGFERLGRCCAAAMTRAGARAHHLRAKVETLLEQGWRTATVRDGGLRSFAAAMAQADGLAEGRDRWLRLWALATGLHLDAAPPDESRAAAARVRDTILAQSAQVEDAAQCLRVGQAWARLARAWSIQSRGHDAELCAQEAARIAAWPATATGPERLALNEQTAQAWAWAGLAYAEQRQPQEARRCAAEVTAIAWRMRRLPPVQRRTVALWRAHAWRSVALALCREDRWRETEAVACRLLAISRSMDALPLPERRHFVELCATAWADVAAPHGRLKRASDARRCAGVVSAQAALLDGLPAVARRTALESVSMACAHAAEACGWLRDGPAAEQYAQVALQASAGLSELPAAELAILAGTQCAAWARAANGYAVTEQAGEAERCTNAILSIASHFDELPAVERLPLVDRQAEGWLRATSAYSGMGWTEDAERCALTIAALHRSMSALPLRMLRGMLAKQAAAWAEVGYAHSLQDRAADTERCAREIRALMPTIAWMPTYGWWEMDNNHALAWRNAASVHTRLGQGQDAERCAKEIGIIVRAMAKLSLDERAESAESHAMAWCWAAQAYRADGMDEDARRCAAEVERITVPWMHAAPGPDWAVRLRQEAAGN